MGTAPVVPVFIAATGCHQLRPWRRDRRGGRPPDFGGVEDDDGCERPGLSPLGRRDPLDRVRLRLPAFLDRLSARRSALVCSSRCAGLAL